MTACLVRQRVGKRCADGAVLIADQQIDVGNFIAVPRERLADVHGHSLSSFVRQDVSKTTKGTISAARRKANENLTPPRSHAPRENATRDALRPVWDWLRRGASGRAFLRRA